MRVFLSVITLLFCTELLAKPAGKYPASMVELIIPSHGDRMSGFIYMAKGEGPHPTIVLLHGYPGNEQNLDLAQEMRQNGWNVVAFHYRGSWGSEGDFSFRHSEQDVQSVLNYLDEKEHAQKLRVDRNRISLVGHSMGGHMAIAGILDNPTVRCAVSLDGANLGANGVGFINDPKNAAMWKTYSDGLFMLNDWSGAKAEQETRMYAKELDLVKRVGTIKGRPVLLVAADSSVLPMQIHIIPVYNALKNTKDSDIIFSEIDDDHAFSNSRDKLIDTVSGFLNTDCR